MAANSLITSLSCNPPYDGEPLICPPTRQPGQVGFGPGRLILEHPGTAEPVKRSGALYFIVFVASGSQHPSIGRRAAPLRQR
jgi:hypothetical protein